MTPTPVVVDEYASVVARMSYPSGCQAIGSSKSSACPCCNTERQGCDFGCRETLNEPSFVPDSTMKQQRNVIVALADEMSHNSDDESDDERDTLPGVLHSGVEYHPTRILVEGWVHKKGTGNDFFGSRGWKARYCRLVLAQVDGSDFEVPLLLVYWFPASDTPTTVITLESTVVVPMDCEDSDDWTKYCFNVVYVRDESRTTRCFTAPQKGRDNWVFAINDALYNYEKTRSKTKLEQQRSAVISPVIQRNITVPPVIHCSDTMVEMSVYSDMSPSRDRRLVPPRPPPRSPPRSDVLVGETFLFG